MRPYHDFRSVGDDTAVEIHRITMTTDGHGKASATPMSGEEGTKVTLSAIPDTGYEFASWVLVSGNGARIDQNRLTIGTGDVTVKATFRKKQPSNNKNGNQTKKRTTSTPPTGDPTPTSGTVVALSVGTLACLAGLRHRHGFHE